VGKVGAALLATGGALRAGVGQMSLAAANSSRYIFGRTNEAMHAVVDPEAPDLAVFERKPLRFSDKQGDRTGSPDDGPALGLHRRVG
jgi:NAD(P)H-hydrate repair Nnr-like enzyme with NAD(P)H-hydrate dehydratase domain